MELPGQGSDPSHSCEPWCSFGNNESFNSLCWGWESNLSPGATEMLWILLRHSRNSRSHPFFLFFFFEGPHLRHMDPRLGVKSELRLQACPHSHSNAWSKPYIGDLNCSSWQCSILNPPSEARDWTHILMDASWVLNLLSHNGSSKSHPFLNECVGLVVKQTLGVAPVLSSDSGWDCSVVKY